AAAHLARGRRPPARRGHRHLRQGRRAGAGRRRAADRADRRADGRRHAGLGVPMDLRDLAGDLVARACAAGARAADVLVGESEGLSVTVRLGETEKLKRARQRRAGLRVLVRDSTAIVSTADLSPPALDALAREACALARATAPDPHAGLPDPAALAREQPDLDLYDAAVGELEPPAPIARPREAEAPAPALPPEAATSA